MLFSINFQRVDPKNAVIPVMDRGFLYGDSVYEVVRTFGRSKPFLFDRHFERLKKSAARLGFELPFDEATLYAHVLECLNVFDQENVYVRIIVTRGEDEGFSLSTPKALKGHVVVALTPVKKFPAEFYTHGVKVKMVSVQRNAKHALDPAIKSGNYLNSVLALQEAEKEKFDDAVMFNERGFLTEVTTSNIFMVKEGVVLTPSLDCGILEGVTRGFLMDILKEKKISFEEKQISRAEFESCDEAFVTSTLKDIMPISQIENRKLGLGEMTKTLMKLFEEKKKDFIF